MDIPFFDQIKPFLFTTHMVVWRNMFDQVLDIDQIRLSLTILIAHILVFLGATLWYFRKKDILS